MQSVSMMGSLFDKIVDFFVGFLAFIPQFIYFLYASIASFLDLLQFLVRKLAGLDVYYVDGQPVEGSGDIVLSFIKGILGIDKSPTYSAVSTVFWSLIIFGVILLLVTTIIAIIKAHYNYDANKSSPMTILFASIKSLATMAIVPIVALIGVYLANMLLRTLDGITSSSSTSVLSSVFEEKAKDKFKAGEDSQGNLCYSSFDYFSVSSYSNTPTFSGMLFEVAGYSCNRVRLGDYSIINQEVSSSKWDNMGVFYVASGSSDQREKLAKQIDYAFSNNLTLATPWSSVKLEGTDDAGVLWSSLRFGLSATFMAGLYNVETFSKYNVGLVWYFYDLWAFNWILGFVGIIICATMFGNIIFGLMTRLLQLIALFIVFPALIGIMPLDEGNAFASWRKQFVSDVLMAFGAVVGMNIFFLILPFFQTISFFNNSFLDGIMNMIIVIAGLTLIKKFIGLVSGFIGGTDANKEGETTRQDVTASAVKGVAGTMGAAKLGIGMMSPMFGGMKSGFKALGNKLGNSKMGQKIQAASKAKADRKTDEKINKMLGRAKGSQVSPEEKAAYSNLKKLDRTERKIILKQFKEDQKEADKQLGQERALGENMINPEENLMKNLTGKEYKQHAENTVNRRYKRAQNVASIFGQDPSKIKKGSIQTDEDGNVTNIETGDRMFKGLGTAFVDFGQTLVKTMGDVTGASGAWKKLADSGAIDSAKESVQKIMNTAGVSIRNKEGAVYSPLATKKDKEADERDRAEQAQKQQLAELKNISEYERSTIDAIKTLTEEIKKKR